MHAAASTTVTETTIEYDSPPKARLCAGDHAGASITAVLGFALDSPALWGAGYALVQDPDGNAVGLMRTMDRRQSNVPTLPG